MKKLLCLTLTMILSLSLALPGVAEDTGVAYTVADKLVKQLDAGSGFSGTLQLTLSANAAAPGTAVATAQPLDFQWDYIHVRADASIAEEQRMDLALMNGDAVQSAAHFQWKDQALSLQADLLGEGWYRYALTAANAAVADGQSATVSQQMNAALRQWLMASGVPGTMTAFLPIALGLMRQNETLSAAMERFLTRVDMWLEGYRESTVIGKLDDGTVTMELHYAISPTNIKAQLKQMVMDLLADKSIIARMEDHFGADAVAVYLNPDWQPYYFAVIDALPLTGDLTIDRKVSLKGETLSLSLSLPYYDPESGSVTLTYARAKGEDDLPENVIAMESEQRVIRLSYLEYNSLTDVTVIQGTLSSDPAQAAAYAVTDDAASKPLAVAFALSKQITEGADESGRDTYQCHYELTLAPDGSRNADEILNFDETAITLDALFASKPLKKAATEVTATLSIGGEKRAQGVSLTLNGKTRAEWTPAELPAEVSGLNDMSAQDLNTLLEKAAVSAGVLLLPRLQAGDASPAATDEPAVADEPAVTDAVVEPMVTDAAETAAP